MSSISQVKVGSSTYCPIAIPLITCDVARATAAKTATLEGIVLEDGMMIKVKFTYGNSVAAPTLAISNGTTSTAATVIKGNASALPSSYAVNGAIMNLTYATDPADSSKKCWIIT